MDNKKFQSFRIILFLIDILIINACYLITGALVLERNMGFSQIYNIRFLIIFNVLWSLSSFIFSIYKYYTLSKIKNIYRKTCFAAVLQVLLFVCYLIFFKSVYITIKLSVTYLIISLPYFILSRHLITYIVAFLLKKINIQKRIAIVGVNESALHLAEYFNNNKSFYSLQGFFDDVSNLSVNQFGEIVHSIENCVDYAAENNINEIYCTILPHEKKEIRRLIISAEKKCISVKFVVHNAEPTVYYKVNFINNLAVLTVRSQPLLYLRNRIQKRIMDIIFSFCIIIFILIWIIPVIGLIIKSGSRGPVFFVQNRSGLNNRLFKIFKFRTMTVTETDQEYKQVTKNDLRITKIGKFLRRTSLDEIPQFFNVFLGHMSLVGPRPHPIKLNETYLDSIEHYMSRHLVKPGITGWAQTNGYRGETEEPHLMEKRIEHDIWYLENWSLLLDIKILFQTVVNILKGEDQAY